MAAGATASSERTRPPQGLARLDDLVYRVERQAAAVLFLVMGLVVFADVLHRIFSRPDGRVAYFLYRMLGGLVPAERWAQIAPWLILAAVFGLFYAAVRTRRPDPGRTAPAPRAAALWAAGLTAGATALVQGFVWLVPSGIVWAPYFALSAMLWVGFIGASMATYKRTHLALEMGEKIWPAKVKPYVQATARLVTASFCVFLLGLAYLSTVDHFGTWATNHNADVIPSVEWPKWAVFLVLPVTFAAMALRFARQAVDVARGRDEAPADAGDGLPK